MIPLPDWDRPVFTDDTDEAFRDSEHPKPRYVWADDPQDKQPGGTDYRKWMYEELYNEWDAPSVGGRA